MSIVHLTTTNKHDVNAKNDKVWAWVWASCMPPAAKEVRLLTRAAALLKVEFSNKVLPIQSSAFWDREGQQGKAMIQTPNPQKRTKNPTRKYKTWHVKQRACCGAVLACRGLFNPGPLLCDLANCLHYSSNYRKQSNKTQQKKRERPGVISVHLLPPSSLHCNQMLPSPNYSTHPFFKASHYLLLYSSMRVRANQPGLDNRLYQSASAAVQPE